MGFPPSDDKQGVPFYSYTIAIGAIDIGTIQRFSPSSTRTVERLRNINAKDGSKTIAVVPNRVDHEITLDKVSINQASILALMGGDTNSFKDPIALLRSNFDIVEKLFVPSTTGAIPDNLLRTITYNDCRAQNWSETVDQGTTFVIETITVWVRAVTIVTAGTAKAATLFGT